MHRVENKTAPSIFFTKFCKPLYSYSTNFSAHNFINLEQHFDSSRKNPRKSSKIQDNYEVKTFNDK